jgi:hypothetical protein
MSRWPTFVSTISISENKKISEKARDDMVVPLYEATVQYFIICPKFLQSMLGGLGLYTYHTHCIQRTSLKCHDKHRESKNTLSNFIVQKMISSKISHPKNPDIISLHENLKFDMQHL